MNTLCQSIYVYIITYIKWQLHWVCNEIVVCALWWLFHFNGDVIVMSAMADHQPHNYLLNRLFRHRSKKTSKLGVTGLCAGNSSVTGEFPAQRASHENVSIWWRHHKCHRGIHRRIYRTNSANHVIHVTYGDMDLEPSTWWRHQM